MTTHRLINRRMAIAEMGKAGLAIVVFGTAACSDGGADATTTAPGTTPVTTAMPSTTTTTSPGSTTTSAPATTTAPAASTYQRVNLDFVSAYILYRGGEAALVDTGVEGSAACHRGRSRRGRARLGLGRARDPDPQAPGSRRKRRRGHGTGNRRHAVRRARPTSLRSPRPRLPSPWVTATVCSVSRSSIALATPQGTSVSSMPPPGSW